MRRLITFHCLWTCLQWTKDPCITSKIDSGSENSFKLDWLAYGFSNLVNFDSLYKPVMWYNQYTGQLYSFRMEYSKDGDGLRNHTPLCFSIFFSFIWKSVWDCLDFFYDDSFSGAKSNDEHTTHSLSDVY